MTTLPKIGTTITATMRQDNEMYLVWQPETVDYTGTIVPSFPWMNSDQFCMTTGLINYPVRTLRLSHVEKMVDSFGKQSTISMPKISVPTHWTVQGSKGDTYVVNRTNDRWACTCIAGPYGKICRHIKQAQLNNS